MNEWIDRWVDGCKGGRIMDGYKTITVRTYDSLWTFFNVTDIC